MDNLKKQLRDEEGEVLSMYLDSEGYATISVGVLIDKRKGGGLLPEESEFIFNNRLNIAKEKIDNALPWAQSMLEPRYAVLIEMCYQMGLAGLLGFKMVIGCLQRGDYEGAAYQLGNSLWAKQTPNRAQRMIKQMQTGEWVFK